MFKPWVVTGYGASELFEGKRFLVACMFHHSREHPVGSIHGYAEENRKCGALSTGIA